MPQFIRDRRFLRSRNARERIPGVVLEAARIDMKFLQMEIKMLENNAIQQKAPHTKCITSPRMRSVVGLNTVSKVGSTLLL